MLPTTQSDLLPLPDARQIEFQQTCKTAEFLAVTRAASRWQHHDGAAELQSNHDDGAAEVQKKGEAQQHDGAAEVHNYDYVT